MDTTFHRAVDMTQDYLQAIEDIISTGCTRILTSGGHDKAIDGISNISQAVSLSSRRIEIMAGSGVSSDNALILASTGVDALHFSAKKLIPGKMKYHNPHISMGGSSAIDEYSLRVVDEEEVSKIRRLVREHSR
jgi:copper homeostasis protein